jgi:hypothetical protein
MVLTGSPDPVDEVVVRVEGAGGRLHFAFAADGCGGGVRGHLSTADLAGRALQGSIPAPRGGFRSSGRPGWRESS